ncbi:MAG: hypothetical protein BWY77_01200 [bacterium ADurb.Bin431]|nr:MAG: hypothetical protein BWY77_01200 [bacterium ADurb.Bin431]
MFVQIEGVAGEFPAEIDRPRIVPRPGLRAAAGPPAHGYPPGRGVTAKDVQIRGAEERSVHGLAPENPSVQGCALPIPALRDLFERGDPQCAGRLVECSLLDNIGVLIVRGDLQGNDYTQGAKCGEPGDKDDHLEGFGNRSKPEDELDAEIGERCQGDEDDHRRQDDHRTDEASIHDYRQQHGKIDDVRLDQAGDHRTIAKKEQKDKGEEQKKAEHREAGASNQRRSPEQDGKDLCASLPAGGEGLAGADHQAAGIVQRLALDGGGLPRRLVRILLWSAHDLDHLHDHLAGDQHGRLLPSAEDLGDAALDVRNGLFPPRLIAEPGGDGLEIAGKRAKGLLVDAEKLPRDIDIHRFFHGGLPIFFHEAR